MPPQYRNHLVVLLLLAHEIYHHLDLARPRSLAQRYPITSLKLGSWQLKTEVPAMAEIAAGRVFSNPGMSLKRA